MKIAFRRSYAMLYACPIQYAMPRCCATPCLYYSNLCSHQCAPVPPPPSSLVVCLGTPLPFPVIGQVFAVQAGSTQHVYSILESWPGSGDASGQALCRSLVIAPTLHSGRLFLVPLVPPGHGSGPSWSLPTLQHPRPRLWLHCKLHLQSQFTVCTLLLLSQLNPSPLPVPLPDFRISLCASCLCHPSLPP